MSSDPCFTALEPVSLIMRRMECMYCFKGDTDVVLVDTLFGLKTCKDHKPNAERDCKAYLHARNMVRVKDAKAHPVLGKFISILNELGTFSVERTDGSIQPGWMLVEKEDAYDLMHITRIDAVWSIPVFVEKGSSRIFKKVPIINFLNPAIHVASSEFRTCIEDAIDSLNYGIYLAEAEEFQKAKLLDRVGEIVEIEGVQRMFYEGVEGRVYIPHGLSNPEPAAEAADPTIS